MSDAPQDAYQRLFSLSMLSNCVSSIWDKAAILEQKMFWELSHFMKVTGAPPDPAYAPVTPDADTVGLIGEWELVWGPAVLTTPGGGAREARNAMFVARCPRLSPTGDGGLPAEAYVVAIAATNKRSIYDWALEDAHVDAVVDWFGFRPGDYHTLRQPAFPWLRPYISAATALGLSDLLELHAPAWLGAAPSTSLAEYLRSITDRSAMLAFVGHSLAGALAPAMALYFIDHEPLGHPGGLNLVTYPTAGATPGSRGFAERFQEKLPPSRPWGSSEPYQHLNVRLWNHYDVIPHAWAVHSHTDLDGNESPKLTDIPMIYGEPHGAVAVELTTLVSAAVAVAGRSGMHYHTLPGARLEGTKPATPPATMKDFLAELARQHVQAYNQGLILRKPITTAPLPSS